ncbi:MAG: diacylglycerol kinase family protein [Candidatus Roizmanbacteria bacterium]
MIHHLHKHGVSLKNAWAGIVWSYKTQHNFRLHTIIASCVIFLGFGLHISNFEFAILILVIVLGLAIEAINTAIEELADAIDTTWREDIKIAKDVSAGAMLLFAFGSIIIAFIIFIPKFWMLIF